MGVSYGSRSTAGLLSESSEAQGDSLSMPSQKRERRSRLETAKTAKSIGTGPYNVNDEKEKNQNA